MNLEITETKGWGEVKDWWATDNDIYIVLKDGGAHSYSLDRYKVALANDDVLSVVKK